MAHYIHTKTDNEYGLFCDATNEVYGAIEN